MLINYTNKSFDFWSKEQKEEAKKEYSEIIDFPFPEVEEEWDDNKAYHKAGEELKKIIEKIGEDHLADSTTAVLCDGERNFCFIMTNLLISKRVKVIYAVFKKDGRFQNFRQYYVRKFPKNQTELFPAIYGGNSKEDKVLIAQLGKGGYQTTTYVDETGNKLSTTGYGFDAIIRKENPNKLLLIGTTESGWREIVEWYGKAKNLTEKQEEKKKELLEVLKKDSNKRKENEKMISEQREEVFEADSSIWREIEQYIKEIAKFEQVKIGIIPKGKNDEELVQYFDILRQALQDITQKGKKTEVIFDISNGFRSMPLYIMMIVKFVGLVNQETIQYMAYYGMFEAKDKENRTPLVNLTKVTEMTEWINAISEFRNFGSVKALYQCLEMEKQGKDEEQKKEIDEMIQSFEEFDSAVNMNNLYYLKKGIEYIQGLDSNFMPLPQQAKVMLESLAQDFKNRFIDNKYKLHEKYEYTYILMKLSKLYMEQGRYNMAAIASQEGIITYIMERYLKEAFKERLFLDNEAFWEYVQNFDDREEVKSYFDNYLNNKKGELEEKYPFGDYYKKIKDKIRNVGAHIIADEKMPTLEDMEKWIYVSINSVLKDMGGEIEAESETVELRFEEIYKDFIERAIQREEERKKIENIKAAKETLFGKKGSEGALLEGESEKDELDYMELCREYGLNKEKLKELHKTILFVYEKNKKKEKITEEEINKEPMLEWILELRDKQGRQEKEREIKNILEELQKGQRMSERRLKKNIWLEEMLKSQKERGESSKNTLLEGIEKGKGLQGFRSLMRGQWANEIIRKIMEE